MTREISSLPGTGGVFRIHAPAPQAMLDAAGREGMQVAAVGLQGARDKNAFLNAIAGALAFPEYFGHNWDAFYDCLTDLAPGKGGGLLLVLRQASGFARAEPEEFASAVGALQDAVDFWASRDGRLQAVIELEAAVLAPELPEISRRA